MTGGSATGEAGYFFEPTVLTDVPLEADLMREEIIGPVATITTFCDDEQGIEMANDSEYGLVAHAFTKDFGRAIAVSEALEFAMVGINQCIVSNAAALFGGVKHSGFGREGGAEGNGEYLSTKYVGIMP